jgi:cell division protein FtsB
VSRRPLLWCAVAAAAALAAFSATAEGGFRRYSRLSGEVDDLKTQNRAVAAKNARLLAEIQHLRSDDAAIERAAREELGFVRPGEVVISLESP